MDQQFSGFVERLLRREGGWRQWEGEPVRLRRMSWAQVSRDMFGYVWGRYVRIRVTFS